MNTNNQVAAFNFNTHNIRVVTIGDQPWFVAKDVCTVLGYTPAPSGGYAHHLAYHLDATERHSLVKGATETLYGSSELFTGTSARIALISESGLYKLALNSRKPEAKPFQNWVSKEVLPSIRKTGSFVTGQPSLVENPTMSKTALARAQMTAMQAIYEALEEQERVQAEQAKTIAAQNVELQAVKVQVEEVLNYATVFDYNKTYKLKLSVGARSALGKAASAIVRSEGWIIKAHPFTGAGMYPIKALDKAAKELKIIK